MIEQEQGSGRRPRTRSFVVTLAIVAAMAVLVAACGDSSDSGSTDATVGNVPVSEGEPTTGGQLVMAVTAETNGWNPALAQWADAGNFVGSSFLEPLFVTNPDGEIVPWLAESVTPDSEQYDVWTVKLRPGIFFHDGVELKAANVKAGLELAIFEGLSGIALGDYFDRVDVVDDYTAKVHLTIKWATFPYVIAGPNGYQMALSMLETEDKGATKPVGTGPYEFESWNPDESVKVRKYYG
jgi:peptide/nickel transport system substrate-binding protein